MRIDRYFWCSLVSSMSSDVMQFFWQYPYKRQAEGWSQSVSGQWRSRQIARMLAGHIGWCLYVVHFFLLFPLACLLFVYLNASKPVSWRKTYVFFFASSVQALIALIPITIRVIFYSRKLYIHRYNISIYTYIYIYINERYFTPTNFDFPVSVSKQKKKEVFYT